MKKTDILITILAFLFVYVCIADYLSAEISIDFSEVPFRLIYQKSDSDIPNTKIYIYNGDYEFKIVSGNNVYPYDDSKAKTKSWFIGTATTDSGGRFTLDLSKIDATNIIIKAGKNYRIVDFERSSNLSHEKSNWHIRVIRFEENSTRVSHNDIYDLQSKTVKKFWPDGNAEEKPFEEIILFVQNEE